ncbi:MAG: autotransporter outer membrane beta-barrel domain-containing protein [Saprospiraceae bacterium]|nr:autotransporter outer membrane beta-barrel domain-containing protein [Saprospiraceae bacterium]
MQKIICFYLLFFCCSTLNAQTEKGRIITGTILDAGNSLNGILVAPANTLGLSFSNVKVDFGGGSEIESRVTTFTLSPRIGYFITDGFALGLNTSYLFQRVNAENNDGETTLNLYSLGPFARYYFQIPNFQPFIEASINLGQIKQESTFGFGGPSEGTSIYRDVFLGVGGAYFIKNTIALEVTLGFRSLNLEADPDVMEQTESTNTLGMRIGFQILLN